MALSRTDPTSFSNPDEALVTHIDLDLAVDFEKHVLTGYVNLTVERLDSHEHVHLDSKDLIISSVTDKASGQSLQYSVGDKVGNFGSKLEVKLPTTVEKKCVVTIVYETSPQASALQWLRPSQTAGKRQPYLFSQCQAIHCRSMIPCQDTPYVKCPYTAKIKAPREIKILMSALLLDSEPCADDAGSMVHSFLQEVPMPSYLIAIVGGDLVSRDIGPRSKVWSEEEVVDKAAYEFAETEQMLKTAEELMGPYVWGRYDLLVLPPSFPYGGMENPCLTFVTPTLLAGDRSLADVVAHEIAHSWTGNLVTNRTFEDFWLNEGNTKLIERKIVQRLKGGESYRQFLSSQGWVILRDTVDVLGAENPYTRLVTDLKGVDPDDAFSAVPYEKGHALLFYLEGLLGGPEVFEPFLRAYIEKFKYKSLDTTQWKDFLYQYFRQQADNGVFEQVDWDAWLYGLGMPPVKPSFDRTMAEVCESLAKKWTEQTGDDFSIFSLDDINNLLTVQVIEFLAILLSEKQLSLTKVLKMQEIYKFSDVQNSEIAFKWLRLCIKARLEAVIPPALELVNKQGRMKFTGPIYRDLYEWEVSREAAISNFQKHRDQMHTTTENLIAKTLKLK